MPWEKRNGCGPYYFRARREGDRIVKTYCGGGLRGKLAELEDLQAREDRQSRAEKRRRTLAYLDGLAEQMEAFSALTDTLLQATLTEAGYHRHKRGEWRRRRERNKQPGDP